MPAVTHYTTKPQLLVPTAGIGTQVTPSGTAWVDSSWVELTTGLGFDALLVGVAFSPGIGGVDYILEIGKGAAGSEVVAGATRGGMATIAGDNTVDYFIIPIKVVASTRLAVRMRKSGTSTAVWLFKLLHYELEVVAGAAHSGQLVNGPLLRSKLRGLVA